MWQVAKHAVVLADLGLGKGDRIALNMPNVMEQIYFTEAAKRLGIIYTPVFGGFSAKTLSDRIHDAGAKVVITTDGAYRNAQVVGFEEPYTDRALDDYVPLGVALEIVRLELLAFAATSATAALVRARRGVAGTEAWIGDGDVEAISKGVAEALAGEITVERADVMRGVGRALEARAGWDAATKARMRTAIAEALAKPIARVEKVVVVRNTGLADLAWVPGRDVWAHELAEAAERKLLAAARAAGVAVESEAAALALDAPACGQAVWATTKPLAVDAGVPALHHLHVGQHGEAQGRRAHARRLRRGARAHDARVVRRAAPRPGSERAAERSRHLRRGRSGLDHGAVVPHQRGAHDGHDQHRHGGLAPLPVERALLEHHRALPRDAVQGGVDVPQGGRGRPAERRGREALRSLVAAGGDVLRRAREPVDPEVRHGAAHAPVHQLVLGDRARRHRADALLRQRRLPARARRAHVPAAVGVRGRLGAGEDVRGAIRIGCQDPARAPARGAGGEGRARHHAPVPVPRADGVGRRGARGGGGVARRPAPLHRDLLRSLERAGQRGPRDHVGLHAGRLRVPLRGRRHDATRAVGRRHQHVGAPHRHRGDRGRDPQGQAGQPEVARGQRHRRGRAAQGEGHGAARVHPHGGRQAALGR